MRRSFRYRIIIICLIALLLSFYENNEAKGESPRTAFIILVDLSKTWFDPTHNSRMAQIECTIDQVNASIIDLADRLPKPVSITYLPITDVGILENPLCETIYQPTLIGKSQKAVRSKSDLESKLKICRDLICTQSPRDYTDISGAMTLAIKITDSPLIKNKFIIILSDMKEDLRSGFKASIPNLKGYEIGIVYHVLPEDAPKGDIDERLESWRERFKNKKAERVIDVIDKGNFESSLSNKLGADNGR
jgi:hypothetical protein